MLTRLHIKGENAAQHVLDESHTCILNLNASHCGLSVAPVSPISQLCFLSSRDDHHVFEFLDFGFIEFLVLSIPPFPQ